MCTIDAHVAGGENGWVMWSRDSHSSARDVRGMVVYRAYCSVHIISWAVQHGNAFCYEYLYYSGSFLLHHFDQQETVIRIVWFLPHVVIVKYRLRGFYLSVYNG